MKAYAEKNAFGFWVGVIEYDSGVKAKVTNAFHDEFRASEIANRLCVGYLEAKNCGRLVKAC